MGFERGDPQHFLYFKAMCWVAVDRAIELAPLLHAEHRVDDWKAGTHRWSPSGRFVRWALLGSNQ